jgi:hypothetical protein
LSAWKSHSRIPGLRYTKLPLAERKRSAHCTYPQQRPARRRGVRYKESRIV